MPKIGILTYHFANNFGAVFQAYAVQRLLDHYGYDSEFISYCPDHVEKGGRFWWPTSKWHIKANIVTAFQKYTTIKQKYLRGDQRKRRFDKFRKHHFITGIEEFKTIRQLEQAKLPYQAVVCGSDQIWNASLQYGIDPAYFLDFGGRQFKKISFAASFGKGEVSPANRGEVARLLQGIDHISVREESGLQIVQDLAKRRATWVPDPTLMLDDYSSVTEKTSLKNYAMCYVLRSQETIAEVKELVERELGLPLVVPRDRFKRQDSGISVDPSPEEWLGLIQGADFVVTNSFHGTVFSVIFKKPFISVGLTGAKKGINDRANSMLSRLGLSHRFVEGFNEEIIREKLREPIDWTESDRHLAEWRIEAEDYLKQAISL